VGFCALVPIAIGIMATLTKVYLMKYILIFLILSILFLISACSHPTIDKEAPTVNEINAGEKFRIILPENHDEGHLWKLKGKHEKVVDNMGAVWHGNDKGIYFRFIAAQSGTDTLSFTLFKTHPTTKERDSIKTVAYIIKVTE
jgi:hypothetical protein